MTWVKSKGLPLKHGIVIKRYIILNGTTHINKTHMPKGLWEKLCLMNLTNLTILVKHNLTMFVKHNLTIIVKHWLTIFVNRYYLDV